MTSLVPELVKLSVDINKLILDPNNPRLITSEDQVSDEKEAVDLHIETSKKMSAPENDIDDLVNSIISNGWIPIDYIFVKKLDESRYLVLEGNRRVTALKEILGRDDVGKFDKSSINKVEVMEVCDEGDEAALKEKICYLLGVRHHGSLKKWSPFARAYNIYTRYLELANQDDETFSWEGDDGLNVNIIADTLTIPRKEVRERIQVFRGMDQIGSDKEVKDSEADGAGMKGHYYSLCEEVFLKANKLRSYISQDTGTFLLDESSLERMKNLCNFNKKAREGAAITKPDEWRKLVQILEDDDEEKRKSNLARVEVMHDKPSDVWAERAAELHKPEWDKWLNETRVVLKNVSFGDDLDSDEAKAVALGLKELLQKLSEEDL